MYTFYSQTEKFRGQSDDPGIHPSVNILVSTLFVESFNSLTSKNDKIFVCKYSKNMKSKLYNIENSKTRGQTA